MAIQGLEQAVENLSRISKTAVPGAAAMAINRVASSVISQSASQVARETKVRRKLVKAVSYTHLTLPTTPYV